MKFLNLDLDFFIDGIVFEPRSLLRRANKRHYHPWSPEEVRHFLEHRCGLRRSARIPGRLGVHHDEVFDYWRSLISGTGDKLDIAHVDGHGDFTGARDSRVFVYVQQDLLTYPVAARLQQIDENRDRLTLANYMSFATACHWIERVEFVTHPDWSGNDPYPYFFRDENPQSGLLELRQTRGYGEVVRVEPPVIYSFTPSHSFIGSGFANAFLAQSPNYTPSTADALIPVFAEYIDFETKSDLLGGAAPDAGTD